MDTAIIIFFITTLVNVMLSTIKSILTVKASRKVAALINAIAYGFYAVVVKQMTTVSTRTVVIVTVLCNLIGVYFSMWLLEKFKKDVLWKITVIPKIDATDALKAKLIENGLGFNFYPVNTKYGLQTGFDIFSATQEESKIIKDILQEVDMIKYYIIEIDKQL